METTSLNSLSSHFLMRSPSAPLPMSRHSSTNFWVELLSVSLLITSWVLSWGEEVLSVAKLECLVKSVDSVPRLRNTHKVTRSPLVNQSMISLIQLLDQSNSVRVSSVSKWWLCRELKSRLDQTLQRLCQISLKSSNPRKKTPQTSPQASSVIRISTVEQEKQEHKNEESAETPNFLRNYMSQVCAGQFSCYKIGIQNLRVLI